MPGPVNKTITLNAATAVVGAIYFSKAANGSIIAYAEGSVTLSDGRVDSERVSWVLSGAAETTVRTFMDGQALTRWRSAKGIEAP